MIVWTRKPPLSYWRRRALRAAINGGGKPDLVAGVSELVYSTITGLRYT